jgi:2-iminobutanoate/2-iminopropanoate deaminase
MKKVYKSSEETGAPLSGAYEVDGLVFLSGQIHADANLKLSGETIEEKFEVIMSNIKGLLSEAGLTINDIVRVQLYLTELDELPALNKVYANYFKHPFPVRTAVGVSALPLGASLEIDIIATKNK